VYLIKVRCIIDVELVEYNTQMHIDFSYMIKILYHITPVTFSITCLNFQTIHTRCIRYIHKTF